MDSIISYKNIAFSYKTDTGEDKQLFENFSLELGRGDFTVVLGRNGSGKSTLARMANGMLLPDKGDVISNGINTKDPEHELEIRRNIGLVFQNPDNQIVSTIVEEDVAFGPENLGVPREQIIERVDWALKTVDMEQYRNHATYKLSGGQKQRIAIAGVLALKPKCIVLDEPTSMLDPNGRIEVLETLKKLNREEGITIVMVTHYLEEAVSADRVVVMSRGKIQLDGKCREVFENVDVLKTCGLSLPQPAEIMHRLNAAGIDLPSTALDPDDAAQILSKLF